MDDIWGGYYTQKMIGADRLIYNRASVYQDRNVQDLITNLEKEIIGYRYTLDEVKGQYVGTNHRPKETEKFLEIYFKHFN
jgi:hypothetical protein